MIWISHRGNLLGPNIEFENSPEYIDNSISKNFDVEIDIWVVNGEFFLGHDNPKHKINLDWIINRKNKLWIHCKNIEGIIFMNENNHFDLNYFWHQNDLVTLTSKNYLWAYPGNQPIKNSISVLPEIYSDNISYSLGVCSDYISKYKVCE
jgi:hypothetical protein